jgi:hypothetical protein
MVSCDSADILIYNVQISEEVTLPKVLPGYLNDFCKVSLSIEAWEDLTFTV